MASSTDHLFALGSEENRISSLPDSLTWSPENSIFAAGSQPVDLTGFAFDIVPGSANAGDTITINFRVQNSGDFASGPFQVGFYLSQDAGIGSSGDLFLGTFAISNVPALSNDTVYTVNVTLPNVGSTFWQGDGRYYIGAAVDFGNTVPESNERNNSSVGLLIDYDIIDINNTQAANLKGNSFNLFPEPLTAGGIFNFDFEITNTGGATGTPFNVAFYLSSNSTISTADFLLDTVTISALAANSSTGLLTLTNNLALPGVNDPFWSGDGTYYVGMIIDSSNAVAEINEADNSNTGLLIDYDDVLITGTQLANLQGKSFNLFPEPLTAGGIFNFDFEITNTGGATGTPFNVAFYLSSNSTISTADFLLTTTTVSALAANSTTGLLTLTSNLALPGVNDPFWSGDGTYYVGMIIDSSNAVAEINEADNSNTGLLIDYDGVLVTGTQQANLKGNFFDLVPEPLSAGSLFDFGFEIINTGGATGTPFNVSFYLSSNSTISTADLLLDTVTISALAANSTTGLLTLANNLLPGINDPFWSGDGTYYLGMIVDSGNAIAELNEADNSNTGFLIDYDDVVISGTSAVGTRLNDDFVGTLGGDTYFGLRGDDDIEGRGGNDGLYGDRGDDNLFGGFGSDYLDGGSGDDWLWGVEISAALPGAGEIDILVGNFGADRFYLGDSTRAYYKSANLVDYAVIADFNPLEDTIVLSSATGYSLQQTSGNLPAGIGIFDSTELIGVVQGVSSLNLNASYFLYV